MSKAKCPGSCCKHVGDKLSDARYTYLNQRIDDSKKLAELYLELGIIHGRYAQDVEQLLFEVSMASMSNGLVSGDDVGNACVLPQGLSELSKVKPNGKLKSAVKKHGHKFA
jgi:hypothetical protein